MALVVKVGSYKINEVFADEIFGKVGASLAIVISERKDVQLE